MGRTLVALILALAVALLLLLGTPYAALILDRLQGSWNATGIEHDGSVTNFSFGQGLPRPEWIFIPHGARIVEVSHVTNKSQGRDVGMLEIATHQSFADLRKFYTESLSRADFVVVDQGLGPLNERTAEYLGVAGTLMATRSRSGDCIAISIRRPEGILQTTLVELRWWKAPPESLEAPDGSATRSAPH